MLPYPKRHASFCPGDRSREVIRQTIGWFEARGLKLSERGRRLSTPPEPSGDGSRLCAACASTFHFAP